jgi:ATP-dependent Clp protease protease subunit
MPEKTVGEVNEENRIIFLSGQFNEDRSKEIINQIFKLEAKDPTKDIILYIDSYGGSIHSFLAIHDVIKHITRCDIITVGIGKAMSCGQLLLISGTKGKRFATPNSRILIHQISGFSFGTLSQLEIDIEENQKMQKIIENIILKYTKINKKKLKELMGVDSYISAEEALELGIIDGIIQKATDLYNHRNVKI